MFLLPLQYIVTICLECAARCPRCPRAARAAAGDRETSHITDHTQLCGTSGNEERCNSLFITSLLFKKGSVEFAFGGLTGVSVRESVCPAPGVQACPQVSLSVRSTVLQLDFRDLDGLLVSLLRRATRHARAPAAPRTCTWWATCHRRGARGGVPLHRAPAGCPAMSRARAGCVSVT